MAAFVCGRTAGYVLPSQIKKGHPVRVTLLNLKPGDDLLSHGETPHYHRRCTVSLLSSGWDQVVPMLYGRQANWLDGPGSHLPAQCPVSIQ